MLVDPATWAAREAAVVGRRTGLTHAHGLGRELFGGMRRNVLSAEEGAVTWL
jgi:phosphogluconate dehydratase